MTVEGELDAIARAWRGWRLRDDRLISPEGWSFTFGEIRSIPFLHAQVRTCKATVRAYQEREQTATCRRIGSMSATSKLT